jgi:CRISPR-associated protein Cas7/Csa2 subtype I-A
VPLVLRAGAGRVDDMQFALACKIQLNMHDLNNERAEEIRRVPVVYKVGTGFKLVEEAVAVSGVMLKHFHFENMVNILANQSVNLCLLCRRKEAIRVPPKKINKGNLANWLGIEEKDKKLDDYVNAVWEGTEDDIIKLCAGEDIHGFLRVDPVLRRESLVKFSWMLPIYLKELESDTPTPFVVLQHSRNIREISEKSPDALKQLQMPYPRGYGDGIFGFTSIIDLGNVGRSFTSGKDAIDPEEKKRRQKSALAAYAPMLSGLAGGSLARALPASEVMEVMGVAAKGTPVSIPAPTHPIYDDYYAKSLDLYDSYSKLFNVDTRFFVYNLQEEKREKIIVEKVHEPLDVIKKATEFLAL